uniref:Copper/zinc superoxide dismutase n=1 Tax=Marseillevirus LCMAC102 TaxID=2506603 RepID=A0A481YUW5_9VIRU|nr:MAG: copper/zinc superoxide dismutase [Marseillevirus LCMAC102]
MDLRKGICILKCEKGHQHGIVWLEEIKFGPVQFRVVIRNVTSGKHGFHIHRKGNELDGSISLCDHFNPQNQLHGNINTKNSHAGDLGNLIAVDKMIDTEFVATRVRLSGINSVFGRSLIVHENEDDLGKGPYEDSLTTGHSGKRILWGIIGVDDGETCT